MSSTIDKFCKLDTRVDLTDLETLDTYNCFCKVVEMNDEYAVYVEGNRLIAIHHSFIKSNNQVRSEIVNSILNKQVRKVIPKTIKTTRSEYSLFSKLPFKLASIGRLNRGYTSLDYSNVLLNGKTFDCYCMYHYVDVPSSSIGIKQETNNASYIIFHNYHCDEEYSGILDDYQRFGKYLRKLHLDHYNQYEKDTNYSYVLSDNKDDIFISGKFVDTSEIKDVRDIKHNVDGIWKIGSFTAIPLTVRSTMYTILRKWRYFKTWVTYHNDIKDGKIQILSILDAQSNPKLIRSRYDFDINCTDTSATVAFQP